MFCVLLLNVGKYLKYSNLLAICYKNIQTNGLGPYFTNIQHPCHLWSVSKMLFPKYIPVLFPKYIPLNPNISKYLQK